MQALKWKRPYWGCAIARIHRLEGGGLCALELKLIGREDSQMSSALVAFSNSSARICFSVSYKYFNASTICYNSYWDPLCCCFVFWFVKHFHP